MNYKKTTLSNGLRIITVPMPTLESATVTVWVATGSRFEEESKAGISHFLEHMAFKGGKKYKSATEVSETIDGIGGEFNAATSTEWTNFYVRTQDDNLEVAFDVLSDMLLTPALKEKEITKEKGVIIEEIGMYEDMPRVNIWNKFQDLIYQGNSIARDVIGTKETVSALSRKDFVNYRDKFYFGQNMIVSVSGGMGQEQVKDLTEKYFGELNSKPDYRRKVEFSWNTKPNRLFVQNKVNEQANIIFGFPGHRHGEDTRYAEAVLSTILGGGMSSRLFTEVREKRGLAYSVATDSDHSLDTGYFAAYAGVDPKKASEAIKVMLDEHYKLVSPKHGISKNEFTKAKEFLKGHMALSLENTKSVNSFFAYEELMLGKMRTPEEVFKQIDKVSEEQVLALAKKLFDHKKLHLAIIGPYKDSQKFETFVNQ